MPAQIIENQSLKTFNTFAVAAAAQFFCKISSEQELSELLLNPFWRNYPTFILGSGSNILLTQDVTGLVIKIEISGIELIKENDKQVWLRIGAGENWHTVAKYCIERGYGGIENLILIPGTVGAAPIQNIGAYGVELAQTLEEVYTLRIADAKERMFTRAECKFAYRDSIFKHQLKNKYIITSVVLRLDKQPVLHLNYGAIHEQLQAMQVEHPTVYTVGAAIMRIRQSKLPDPSLLPNAGSFFKNPLIAKQQFENIRKYHLVPGYASGACIKIPAAWLIEACGWKGKRIGKVGVHDKQALVLVNHDGGTGKEILDLANSIQQDVFENFEIELQPEVNIF